MNYKFSDVITELTELWLNWMAHNKVATNEELPIELREEAAKKCEELITKEYQLTAKLDEFFKE